MYICITHIDFDFFTVIFLPVCTKTYTHNLELILKIQCFLFIENSHQVDRSNSMKLLEHAVPILLR